jgi:hypothetical protein
LPTLVGPEVEGRITGRIEHLSLAGGLKEAVHLTLELIHFLPYTGPGKTLIHSIYLLGLKSGLAEFTTINIKTVCKK